MLRVYDDFLCLLQERGRRWVWTISPDGEIRGESPDGEPVCPLTAMAASYRHVALSCGEHRRAGAAIGLNNEAADAIAQAADLRESYNAHIRADLVAALGLRERWAPRGRWQDIAFTTPPYPHQYDRPFRLGYGSVGTASTAFLKVP